MNYYYIINMFTLQQWTMSTVSQLISDIKVPNNQVNYKAYKSTDGIIGTKLIFTNYFIADKLCTKLEYYTQMPILKMGNYYYKITGIKSLLESFKIANIDDDIIESNDNIVLYNKGSPIFIVFRNNNNHDAPYVLWNKEKLSIEQVSVILNVLTQAVELQLDSLFAIYNFPDINKNNFAFLNKFVYGRQGNIVIGGGHYDKGWNVEFIRKSSVVKVVKVSKNNSDIFDKDSFETSIIFSYSGKLELCSSENFNGTPFIGHTRNLHDIILKNHKDSSIILLAARHINNSETNLLEYEVCYNTYLIDESDAIDIMYKYITNTYVLKLDKNAGTKVQQQCCTIL